MINKKRLFKCLTIILLIIIIIFTFIQIRNTLARYETTTSAQRDVDVAFWLTDTSFASELLLLKDEIFPSNTSYEYTFTVSNFDENGRIAETDLQYNLLLTTSTNLPFNYEIQRNGTTCATFDHTNNTSPNIDQVITDDNGTKYVEMKLGTAESPFTLDTIVDEDGDGDYEKTEVTDTFVIKITFPKSYSANEEYRDLIEYVKLDLSASQIIGE